MTLTARSIKGAALFGGLGGAINAWLCYAGMPERAMEFSWWIIPAGACHGALLAALTVYAGARCAGGGRVLTWVVGAALAGWIAGWLSFIPVQLYIGDEFTWSAIIKSIAWPFPRHAEALYMPYCDFGLVTLLWIAFTARLGKYPGRSRLLLAGIGSGMLGSLWWWIAWEKWYFSLIHGAIWGALVGYGVWHGQKTARSHTTSVRAQ